MYLYNVTVSLANLNLFAVKGHEGWGKFETVMKDLCVKCSVSLHEKIFEEGNRKQC